MPGYSANRMNTFEKEPKKRHKQLSSCEACRKAKIGCDAAKTKGTKCSNCLRRKKDCFLKGQNGLPKTSKECEGGGTGSRTASKSSKHRGITNPTNSPPSALEQEASHQEHSRVLHDILWDVFIRVFELRLSLWMASGCCPFQQKTSLSSAPPLLSNLVVRLDAVKSRGHENEDLVNQAFIGAIHAFSMRWLKPPRSASKSPQDEEVQQETSSKIWHQARQKIESAISIPSYRSILALHIFGLTPVPIDHHDDQIRDLCIEIALNHHNRLRASCHLGSANITATSIPSCHAEDQQESTYGMCMSSLQDKLYWFSVLEDTSRSVRQSCSPIMSSSSVWHLVEMNENNFESSFGPLRFFDEPMLDGTAAIMLKHASAGNKFFWACIGRVQDAAKLGRPLLLESSILDAFRRRARIDEVFKLLLERCGRDILLLDEQNQLGYFLVTLHYHLAVLILLDVVPDWIKTEAMTFEQMKIRKGSCVATVNTLSSALQIDVGLQGRDRSILLLDPTPEGLVLVIRRTARSLLMLYEVGEVSVRALNTMIPVLLRGLMQLSEICEGTHADIAMLEKSIAEVHGCESTNNAEMPGMKNAPSLIEGHT